MVKKDNRKLAATGPNANEKEYEKIPGSIEEERQCRDESGVSGGRIGL